jgi:hypothetical protein
MVEDRSVIARRLFDALCAKYPDKYIALIQPCDVVDGSPDLGRKGSGDSVKLAAVTAYQFL